MKQIGMDVRNTTTHIAILNSKGCKVCACRIPTRKQDLMDFFQSVPGKKGIPGIAT